MSKTTTWEEHFEGFDNFGATPFDPWPIAYMWERCGENPDDEGYLQMWRDLYREEEAAQEQWHGAALRSPREQARVASDCLRLRPAIQGGAGGALLEAVALCAEHGIPMPAWIALPFVQRYWAAQSGAYKGWEDAFGPIRGTVKAREAWAMGPSTYRAALTLLEENPDAALNAAFYAEVGATLDNERGHSAVQDIIRDHVKDVDAAPLLYVKQHLQAGGTLRSADSAWFNEKMDRWAADRQSR